MAISGQNFEMHAGDSKQIIISVLDEDGNNLNLSSYSEFKWVIYHPTTKVLILTKTLGDGIAVSGNEITISLVPSDTENLIPRIYNHECEISDGGPVVSTITTGTVLILFSKA